MVWAALCIGAFFGGFTQSIVGFGAAAILVLFLTPFISMAVAPSVVAVVNVGLCLPLLWRLRRAVDWRGVLLPVIVYTVASIAAICMLGSLDLRFLTAAFGAFLVLLSVYFLFFAQKVSVKPTNATAIVCSAVSGICAGLFGVGGPMMALYFVSVFEERDTYLGNLQLLFASTYAVNALVRAASGLFSLSLVPMTLLGVVLINAGAYVGTRLSKRIDTASAKTAVYAGVGVLGAVTLIEQLL